MMKRSMVLIMVGMLGSATAFAEEVSTTLEATVVKEASPIEGKSAASTTSAGEAFDNVVCSNGTHKRRLELKKSDPSEVHYKKETEQPGSDQLLYSGSSNYCAGKAKEFVQKLQTWGWKCDKA